MGASGDGHQALPAIGSRGQAVIDQLLATVTELEYCEHGCADFSFWIAARPGMLLCDFCYQAAQVLAGDIRCAACGQPAEDPGMDAIVVARVAPLARLPLQSLLIVHGAGSAPHSALRVIGPRLGRGRTAALLKLAVPVAEVCCHVGVVHDVADLPARALVIGGQKREHVVTSWPPSSLIRAGIRSAATR